MTCSALAAQNFWAQMRSTYALFDRSSITSLKDRTVLNWQLGDLLGKSIITYPPILKKMGIDENTTYAQKKLYLGIREARYREKNEDEKRFQKFMTKKSLEASRGNWSWRITQEAEAKQTAGWYPFFVTLTVDPKMTDPEKLWKEGRELRKYIRRLVNVVCKELGHPPAHKKTKEFGYRPESDYVTYAGVIEHGKSQEHHHAHLMIWMREIPSLWKKDPNSDRLPMYRTERECKPMRVLWPWAIPSQKPALYFRTKGDIWSKLGHCCPIDKKTGGPIKINQVQAVGNYVTKYMQKGSKIWHHRMKCTRNLGMDKIRKILKEMDWTYLEALSWRPHDQHQLRSVSKIHTVPQGLVRSLAKREVFSRKWEQKRLDLTELMSINCDHYMRMLKSVRDGQRPDRLPSGDFYDWVQRFLPVQDGYCEHRLLKAHKLLRGDFPRRPFVRSPVVIGGNQIGYT